MFGQAGKGVGVMLNEKLLPPYILKQKKVHKMSRIKMAFYGWEVLPVCKVFNTTTAYIGSTEWAKVTCNKCLKKNQKFPNGKERE